MEKSASERHEERGAVLASSRGALEESLSKHTSNHDGDETIDVATEAKHFWAAELGKDEGELMMSDKRRMDREASKEAGRKFHEKEEDQKKRDAKAALLNKQAEIERHEEEQRRRAELDQRHKEELA